jgi:hypothetical protein
MYQAKLKKQLNACRKVLYELVLVDELKKVRSKDKP